ncbi:Glyoxalase family protein [gamma proteobacterium IMCC1989]|nr:Glyoxalase family protein [gamma proteobacterium IMCC1989]
MSTSTNMKTATRLQGVHHVAYRCKDAKETVEWYEKHLHMDFVLAISENQVPSTQEPDPYMHVFLDAGNGNILAFFELPTQPDMSRDLNTPAWVQHLALKVESIEELLLAKDHLNKNNIDVIGPVDHTIFTSIYFFDPNGHRIELAANTDTPEINQRLNDIKWDMLNEWSITKKAPSHGQWLHEN